MLCAFFDGIARYAWAFIIYIIGVPPGSDGGCTKYCTVHSVQCTGYYRCVKSFLAARIAISQLYRHGTVFRCSTQSLNNR